MIWQNIQRIDSADANVFKYVFRLDDAVAEVVLYRYGSFKQRTVICCSTQSGCPVGCRFCGAGDYFVRSLTADEIVAQVTHVLADNGIDLNACDKAQIMFMSMGEPLLNLRALDEAIRRLYINFPKVALLISTSGPRANYIALRQLSREVRTVGLQFSVHESTDASRDALIPFKAKLTLEEIAREGECWHRATGRRPFFNYCAQEHNTSNADAVRLRELFDPAVWECTISVVCERDESIAAANERQRNLASAFMQRMLAEGFSCRMFDPAGQDDIGGGCGQLWFVQDWMRKNPDRAKPSIGRHLPIIHTPCGGAK